MNYFNYFSDIEEVFVRRRGKNLFLNPMDWDLMGVWESRGIPLHIVIRAINHVFDVYDKLPTAKRPISSLSYCKSEVEAQFVEWQTSQVGRHDDPDEPAWLVGYTLESVGQHIDAAIAKLREVDRPELGNNINRAILQLETLHESLTADWQAVDATLLQIEKDLEAIILTSWRREDFEPATREIEAQLAQYAPTMEPDAYQKTFTLMLLKKLRETAGIPRLGLFYL